MQRPQAALLPDGQRLHLQHGPIDLIIGVDGPGQSAAFNRAVARFGTVLDELIMELASLRTPISLGKKPLASGLTRFENRVERRLQTPFTPPILSCRTADRMRDAVEPFADEFVTPMAAVAGAVADEVMHVICDGPGVTKAYVNNGGDIALQLLPSDSFTGAIAGVSAQIQVNGTDPWRGLATSGWAGRSQSLGIADSVTVLAATAATADAAATLIANAVDLPDHPGVKRVPASDLKPDSDLGARLVTTSVPVLGAADRHKALDRGMDKAQGYVSRGLIGGTFLVLQGELRHVGGDTNLIPSEPMHA